MRLKEIPEFRSTAISQLCESQTIKDLLTDTSGSTATQSDLVLTNVFPYEHVPDTQTTARAYITMAIFVPSVQNKTFKSVRIIFYAFEHETMIAVQDSESGKTRMRHDLIAQEIDRIMNGSQMFGLGRLSLSSTVDFSPIDNYFGVAITYDASDFNR